MSGSSHAWHVYRRCVVSLDAGINISWAMDPDGTHDSGRRHHEREEAGFRARLEHAAADIEGLFDELERAGHVFSAPHVPGERPPPPAVLAQMQRASSGQIESCRIQLTSTPPLAQAELMALMERVAALVARVPPPPPPPAGPPPQAPTRARQWWRFW